MFKYQVYELIDDLENSVRYVGIAYDADHRYKQHLRGNDKTNPGKNQWVQGLKAQGRKPLMRVIETADDEGQARRRERHCITEYFRRGYPLLNIAVVPGRYSGAINVTNIQSIRESLGATQEAVAKRTRTINLRTYTRAESGKSSVKYNTAQEILEAINGLLQEAGRDPVKLEDLGLTIY